MSKEKILLINPIGNRRMICFPLGLGYIAGACDREGIEVEFVDANLSHLDNHQTVDTILRKDFHVVGIGGFFPQLKSTIELSNLIKERCRDIVVIAGGIQVFGCEDFIMHNSGIDIICMGESEVILPQLLHTLYSDEDLANVPSIIYRRQDIVKQSGFSHVADIDEINFPKYDVFPMEIYLKKPFSNSSDAGERTVDFLCSRGCPYKCCYCINSKRPVKMRYRSIENILKEIRFLKETYGINDFRFCDEVFTIDKKKALEICEAIKDEKITWLTSCRADSLDEEMVVAVKRAGCRQLSIGFESGSEKILDSMNKRVSTAVYADKIRLLRKHNMHFYSNFMIGMPEETEETIRETEKFCIDNALIFGPSYVVPFPGTKLYDDVQYKITDMKELLSSVAGLDFSKEPVVNLTEMSVKELIRLRSRTVVNTMAHLLHRKFRFIPLLFIKAACRGYLMLFDIKNPSFSRMLQPISQFIYRVLFKNRG